MGVLLNRRFLIWLASSITGALPLMVNIIVQHVTNNLSFYSAFSINDLMYLVITINAITMLDHHIHHDATQQWYSILSFVIHLIFLVLAALLLGFWALMTAMPQASGPFTLVLNRVVYTGFWIALMAIVSNTCLLLFAIRSQSEREVPDDKN